MNSQQLNRLALAILFGMQMFSVADAEPLPANPGGMPNLKGEFILSRNQFQNRVCQRFTQNLNQFRKLDFNVCHRRLSKKYPELSRPTWEEIPFDLQLAEHLFKAAYLRRENSLKLAALAAEHWQKWLEGSAALRTASQARMWRTRIDFDGDGKEETVIRVLPELAGSAKLETEPPWNCDYNFGSLRMMDNVHPEASDRFNSAGGGGDIIKFAEDKRYYRVMWSPGGPADHEIDIGATAGVVLSRFTWQDGILPGGDECLIEWVPTGRYKPLKRRR